MRLSRFIEKKQLNSMPKLPMLYLQNRKVFYSSNENKDGTKISYNNIRIRTKKMNTAPQTCVQLFYFTFYVQMQTVKAV